MTWDYEADRWVGDVADREALLRAGYYGLRCVDFIRYRDVDAIEAAALAAKFAAREAFQAVPELR